MIRIKCIPVFLLGLVCQWAISAQEIWSAAPFALSPQELLKQASALTAPAGGNAVILSDRRTFSFDTEGRETARIHLVYKVLTPAGVEEWSTTGVRWEPWHEQRPNMRARVVTPEGSEHVLDPKTIAEGPAGNGALEFTDARLLQAPLPAVAPGTVVEEDFEVVERTPLFRAGIAHDVAIGRSIPVQHTLLTVDVPAATPLRYAARLLPDAEIRKTEENGRAVLRVEQGPLPAHTAPEPFLPFDMPRSPAIVFSTAESWENIAREYNTVVEPQLRIADVQQLVAGLDLTGKSKLDIANTLLRTLHEQIRYTGVEFGEAAIIPGTPAETLKRKYGDCKDQAAMLVAMLRAAGVPANLALLDPGIRQDVARDLPGFGVFTHAIVYVPGQPDLWADPTDPFARFGELPIGDQGRFALIIDAKGRTATTPESTSRDNRVVETREVLLAESGKGGVIETSTSNGSIEQGYREQYHEADPNELNKAVASYVKETYLADDAAKIEHSDPADLAQPFRVRIEAKNAGRARTETDEAIVAVPLNSLVDQLPDWFRDPDAEKKPRKADLVLPEPFTAEWQYKISAPAGFRLVNLPESHIEHIGPAVLSQEFTEKGDGSLAATFRFDTGKRRYTADEVAELRTAIRKLDSEPALTIRFEQVGESLLAAGRIREALEEFRKLAALHPGEGLHHAQISRALLAAGAGDAARKEARLATELDPQSAAGFAALAWALQHDAVGRRFAKGCDLPAAETAYRKALELDSGDVETRANLAQMLEYSPHGIHYESKEALDRAIIEYQALEGKLSDAWKDNILSALLYARRFDELRDVAAKHTGAAGDALFTAAVAAKQGANAAVAESAKRISGDQARRAAWTVAAQSLLKIRMFGIAADLMEKAAQGSPQAAALRTSIDILRKARPYDGIIGASKGPELPVYRLITAIFQSSFSPDALSGIVSSESPLRRPEFLREFREGVGPARAQLANMGLPPDVTLDLTLGSMKTNVEGDDASGYRVRLDGGVGGQKQTAYVVREAGDYRLVSIDDATAAGALAMKNLDRGNTAAARKWLDWARESQQLPGGDDPLAGPVFPRFWTLGSTAEGESIRYAAASLTAGSPDADKAVPVLKDGLAKAQTAAERTMFNLALAEAYSNLKQPENQLEPALALLVAYPDSNSALAIALTSLRSLQRWDHAEAIVSERLKRHPEDHFVLSLSQGIAASHGDFDHSITIGEGLVAQGRANGFDLNELAWAYLLADRVTPQAVEIAQKAAAESKGASTVLHTLASLYAEIGKASEAREVILKSMVAAGREDPASGDWYVFGRIAEQYGIQDSAREDYARVEKPAETESVSVSAWMLAQRRLKILNEVH